jgi:hypothetical protein
VGVVWEARRLVRDGGRRGVVGRDGNAPERERERERLRVDPERSIGVVAVAITSIRAIRNGFDEMLWLPSRKVCELSLGVHC